MSSQETPPRLHALIARDKNIGIVIRRGPAKHVATFLWDISKDKFTIGQWMKGRIYERRSDLSADGKYFLYFAMNGKWESEAEGAWTAVSKAPYLKAPRLIRDGWTLVEQKQSVTILEKTNRFGLKLRKLAHAGGNSKGQSVYWDEHELITKSGNVEKFPAWEWAEMQEKSLVFSEKGCLYRAKFSGNYIMKAKLLHDFSPYKFEAIRAPY